LELDTGLFSAANMRPPELRDSATCQVDCRFFDKTHYRRESITPINNTIRNKPRQDVGMSDLTGSRYMERLCRQRAILDRAHSWKWLGEAERWKDLAHLDIGDRFREKPIHAGPMAMGPNTIEGDSHRQKHEAMQRLQSVMHGG
jgi:hypothetical protein